MSQPVPSNTLLKHPSSIQLVTSHDEVPKLFRVIWLIELSEKKSLTAPFRNFTFNITLGRWIIRRKPWATWKLKEKESEKELCFSCKYLIFKGSHYSRKQITALCEWKVLPLEASYLQDVSEEVMVEHWPVLSADIHDDFAELVPDEVRQSFVVS